MACYPVSCGRLPHQLSRLSWHVTSWHAKSVALAISSRVRVPNMVWTCLIWHVLPKWQVGGVGHQLPHNTCHVTSSAALAISCRMRHGENLVAIDTFVHPRPLGAPDAPDAPTAPDAPDAPTAPDAPRAPDAPTAPDAPVSGGGSLAWEADLHVHDRCRHAYAYAYVVAVAWRGRRTCTYMYRCRHAYAYTYAYAHA